MKIRRGGLSCRLGQAKAQTQHLHCSHCFVWVIARSTNLTSALSGFALSVASGCLRAAPFSDSLFFILLTDRPRRCSFGRPRGVILLPLKMAVLTGPRPNQARRNAYFFCMVLGDLDPTQRLDLALRASRPDASVPQQRGPGAKPLYSVPIPAAPPRLRYYALGEQLARRRRMTLVTPNFSGSGQVLVQEMRPFSGTRSSPPPRAATTWR